MEGRVSRVDNDVFFVCSLIDYISRKTKNKRSYVVNKLGKDRIGHIYELADIYHSDNIDRVSDDFIEECNIHEGDFDNVATCKYTVPSHFDIGKVYKRLVLGISREKNMDIVDAIFEAYNSYVSDKIDDYNSSFYYDSPQNILNAYIYGMIE
ncbi:hypothetical protein Z969_08460 [Clostridium novyi A str. 4570]|uniref:Uncharacterized protein n=1 Tax=Clostridium novyi A str. 4570 TaxID=1444290 RepID=A0AA88ZLA3_CLONO|nr:hypothetical protein [Clostridium novyi]KGN01464.1 hypothetical protein Z969_08460 [Clostridium novyi A str. 4570]